MKEQEVAFERCIEFLANMIEKYGKELSQELLKEKPLIIRSKQTILLRLRISLMRWMQ